MQAPCNGKHGYHCLPLFAAAFSLALGVEGGSPSRDWDGPRSAALFGAWTLDGRRLPKPKQPQPRTGEALRLSARTTFTAHDTTSDHLTLCIDALLASSD